LRAAVARMAPSGDSARPVALAPEQEERLRSLGYTSGSGGGGGLDEPGLPEPRTRVKLYERIQAATRAPGASTIAHGPPELTAIAEADPGNPYAHYSLANMAYHHGDLALAARAYARTMELDPDRPAMRAMYGRLLRDKGDLPEAERQLRIAAEQTTEDDVGTRMVLADILLDSGHTGEAATIIEGALRKGPGHVDPIRATGRLLVATGQGEAGFQLLEQAARGSDPEPWIEIARF